MGKMGYIEYMQTNELDSVFLYKVLIKTFVDVFSIQHFIKLYQNMKLTSLIEILSSSTKFIDVTLDWQPVNLEYVTKATNAIFTKPSFCNIDIFILCISFLSSKNFNWCYFPKNLFTMQLTFIE